MLISSLGGVLKYVNCLAEVDYMDHVVEYIWVPGEQGIRGRGSRTNDGYTFRNKRNPMIDHDIVAIIPYEVVRSL